MIVPNVCGTDLKSLAIFAGGNVIPKSVLSDFLYLHRRGLDFQRPPTTFHDPSTIATIVPPAARD